MLLTDSNTIKICWYWPDTDTDTRIGAALLYTSQILQGKNISSIYNLIRQIASSHVVTGETHGKKHLTCKIIVNIHSKNSTKECINLLALVQRVNTNIELPISHHFTLLVRLY